METISLKNATKQREAIKSMLHFHEHRDESEKIMQPVWKVLVYDRYGQDIISPLFTVAELRECGVTLHLLLHSDRDPVPETSAIYFVHPTEDNLKRIYQDMRTGLYSSYYLSFISHIPRICLENLANMCVDLGSTAFSLKIYDEYLNFVSLEEGLFISKNYGRENISFSRLNSSLVKLEEMNEMIHEIADTIFSLIATLGVFPIIKCQIGNASELVAKELDKRIRDVLMASKSNFLFGCRINNSKRPLLFLYDRCNDLCPPLHHTWTYQALIDDIFGIRLNRITIEDAATNKQKFFDLSPIDKFMQDHKFSPFPTVASDIQKEIEDYKAAEARLKLLNTQEIETEELLEDLWSSNTSKLTSAVNSLPDLLKRKKFIDMHTNIATEIMERIKERKLGQLFEIEESILSKSLTETNSIMEILYDKNVTPNDKLRLYLISYLCDFLASQAELEQATSIFESLSIPHASIKYATQCKSFTKLITSQNAAANTRTTYGSVLSRIVAKSPEFVVQSVKNLVMRDKNLPLTRIVLSFLEGKGFQQEANDFLTLDSRNYGPNTELYKPTSSFQDTKNNQFDDVIVFVVGGGCYMEYENIMSSLSKRHLTQKNVIYGCTELLHPSSILSQLNELGSSHGT